MATILKLMMLVLTLFCVGFAILSVMATKKAAEDSPKLTVEEVLRREPHLSRADAERRVATDRSAQAIAGGCCVLGGTGTAGIVWFAGMIPLTVLYLVFRPKTPTVVQIERRPPTKY